MIRPMLKSILTGVALVFMTNGAYAQCSGQPGAGLVCGNPSASVGLPTWATNTSLLDRAFGTTQNTILNRGASVWAETSTPILGRNGGTGGSLTLNGSTSGTAVLGVKAAAGSTTFNLPVGNGSLNQVLITDGSGNTSWSAAGAGTVSSVGLTLPSVFIVSGSPVTGAGTLTATLNTQAANTHWSGPTTGAAATPTFRVLVGADLPNPSSSSLGGVQSFAAISSQWIRQISTSGIPTASQPAFTDISGTLAPAQCPNPSASTLGCIQSFVAQSSKWINTISTSGVPSATQPSFSDILGSATLAQLPSISNNSVLGNRSGGTAVPSALTASNVLDFIGTTQGQVLYRNATTWVTLAPGTNGQVLTTAGAAANPTWTTVTGTGTVTSIATNNGVTGGTITTTGTIGLATITAGTVLANVTGGSAIPIANTPSDILDLIGSTTGDILYRTSGSGWSVLAPGTNGQVLTQGASTPAWGNVGTLTNVTIANGTGIGSSGTCNISTSGTCTIINNGVLSIAGNTGAFTLGVGLINATNDIRTSLSNLTNALGSDVNMNTTGFFDGPTVAQGTSGTWLATGSVNVLDTSAQAAISCKLWDGTTTFASSLGITIAANFPLSVSLSGVMASPAGNIRISCADSNGSPSGRIKANASGSGKDSIITVVRIQ